MYDIAASIVTYRSDPQRLRAAVESLRAQEGVRTHLTLVDNHSGADYVAQLKRLKPDRLIEAGANRGFGFGHNIAIRQAPRHRYYLILNPDVVLHEGCLRAMVAHLDAHPDIGLLAPQVRFPDGTRQYLNKRLPSVFDLFARRFLPAPLKRAEWARRRMERYEMRDLGYDKPVDVPFISGCCMLLRADALQRCGGFDEGFFMYLEDCDLTRRVRQHASAVYYPGAVITHHWARGSHHSWRLTWVMLRSMLHYFNKWGWKWL